MKRGLVALFTIALMVCMTSSYVIAGTVEQDGPQFAGYEKAGQYWVKVAINDVRGRLSVQLLNEYGEPDMTSIAKIDGKVIFADGTEQAVTFRPERVYWNETEDNYSDQPIGYSAGYYVMGSWLKGVGCVDTVVNIQGEELTFTCQSRAAM